jgi:hypothetical protein
MDTASYFGKDLLDKILKMYLADFTFDKLFGKVKTLEDANKIIKEILNIPKLKSVCQRWRVIIENYMGRYWGLKLKNRKPDFKNMYKLQSKTSLRHILMGDITYATKDKFWGTIKILTLKRGVHTPYIVRYINFNLGAVPKINLAVDIELDIDFDTKVKCIPEKMCFNSFVNAINKFLFKRNVGPPIKFKKCDCSESSSLYYTFAYPSRMETESAIFIPPLNKLEASFLCPNISYVDIIDIEKDLDGYVNSSPYYKSVHADIQVLKDYYFFQGLRI